MESEKSFQNERGMSFNDLLSLDNKTIQLILRKVNNDVLTCALKTAPTDLQEKFFHNVSSRAAEMIRNDLEDLFITNEESFQAQQFILDVYNRLETRDKDNLES